MKQDKKDVLLKTLKESFGLFGLSDSVGDHIFDKISYEKLRYYNLDFVAAAIFANSDPKKFKEALKILEKENTVHARLTLAGYTKRLSEKAKVFVPYETFVYLQRFPKEVVNLTLDLSEGRDITFDTALTIEEYHKYSLDLPQENSYSKSVNLQRILKLVNLGWFIPNIDSRKIYLAEKKKMLIFSGEPQKIPDGIQKVHFLNYMKWAIAVATNWTYFAEVFDELASDENLIQGLLEVANLEITLKALRRSEITVDDLSLLFYKAELPIEFKELNFETVEGGLYARIKADPFLISSKEGILNCVNIANDYSPIIGNVEIKSGTFMTEHEIQFLFFDLGDEFAVRLGNINLVVGINEALVVSGSVEVEIENCLVVI